MDAASGGPCTLEALYDTAEFRMYCMKVLPCPQHFSHDWTECPFAHPGERATRRAPHKYGYTGVACPSMKRDGSCAIGSHCPYSHNVFEYWLHPTRYRTQLCSDGSKCPRKICFFAHSLEELRTPEAGLPRHSMDAGLPRHSVDGRPSMDSTSSMAVLTLGRFSQEVSRLSQDLGRMSFEAATRPPPPPTANPYASSLFASVPPGPASTGGTWQAGGPPRGPA